MGGFFGPIGGGSSSGGGPITGGALATTAPAAGVSVNLLPAVDWPGTGAGTYGRLDVDTTAGDVTINSLVAGAVGQQVLVRNTGINNLTLAVGVGSTPITNRFTFLANLTLPSFGTTFIEYSDGRWVIVG